jgi:hypothetical protein
MSFSPTSAQQALLFPSELEAGSGAYANTARRETQQARVKLYSAILCDDPGTALKITLSP